MHWGGAAPAASAAGAPCCGNPPLGDVGLAVPAPLHTASVWARQPPPKPPLTAWSRPAAAAAAAAAAKPLNPNAVSARDEGTERIHHPVGASSAPPRAAAASVAQVVAPGPPGDGDCDDVIAISTSGSGCDGGESPNNGSSGSPSGPSPGGSDDDAIRSGSSSSSGSDSDAPLRRAARRRPVFESLEQQLQRRQRQRRGASAHLGRQRELVDAAASFTAAAAAAAAAPLPVNLGGRQSAAAGDGVLPALAKRGACQAGLPSGTEWGPGRRPKQGWGRAASSNSGALEPAAVPPTTTLAVPSAVPPEYGDSGLAARLCVVEPGDIWAGVRGCTARVEEQYGPDARTRCAGGEHRQDVRARCPDDDAQARPPTTYAASFPSGLEEEEGALWPSHRPRGGGGGDDALPHFSRHEAAPPPLRPGEDTWLQQQQPLPLPIPRHHQQQQQRQRPRTGPLLVPELPPLSSTPRCGLASASASAVGGVLLPRGGDDARSNLMPWSSCDAAAADGAVSVPGAWWFRQPEGKGQEEEQEGRQPGRGQEEEEQGAARPGGQEGLQRQQREGELGAVTSEGQQGQRQRESYGRRHQFSPDFRGGTLPGDGRGD